MLTLPKGLRRNSPCSTEKVPAEAGPRGTKRSEEKRGERQNTRGSHTDNRFEGRLKLGGRTFGSGCQGNGRGTRKGETFNLKSFVSCEGESVELGVRWTVWRKRERRPQRRAAGGVVRQYHVKQKEGGK